MRTKALVVEADKTAGTRPLAALMSTAGYSFLVVKSLSKAIIELKKNAYTFIAVDLPACTDSGIRLVRGLHLASPNNKIVVFTSNMNPKSIMKLLRAGAWDCQEYPQDFNKLDEIVFQAVSNWQSNEDCNELRQVLYFDKKYSADNNPLQGLCVSLLGGNQKLTEIEAPFIIVHGECGTGKRVIAEIIHYNTALITSSLISINVEEAVRSRMSSAERNECLLHAIQEAKGGTLLLENIGDLPVSEAPIFCQTLYDTIKVDMNKQKSPFGVRVIMTQGPGKKTKRKGHINQTINIIKETLFPEEITIPSLRRMPELIPDLVGQYLCYSRNESVHSVSGVENRALRCLMFHDWPGNLREFTSVLEGATMLCQEGYLSINHLPTLLTNSTSYIDVRN